MKCIIILYIFASIPFSQICGEVSSKPIKGLPFLQVLVNGKYGFIDRGGLVVVKPEYDDALQFQAECAPVCKNNKWGLIDQYNNVICPLLYDDIQCFQDNMAVVRLGNKYGIINNVGSILLNPIYDYIGDFYRLEYRYMIGELCGTFDKYGVNTTYKCDLRSHFENNRAAMISGGTIAEHSFKYNGEISKYIDGGKYGYINRDQEIIIPAIYTDFKPFSEGYAAVKNEYKWGYVNTNGKVCIPFRYSKAEQFNDGLAVVEYFNDKITKWAYVNYEGNIMLGPYDRKVYSFHNGYAWICSTNAYNNRSIKYVAINKYGKQITTEAYDDYVVYDEGVACVTKNNKMGYIDIKGNIVLPIKYTRCHRFYQGYGCVIDKDKLGWIDKNGSFIWKPKK